MNQLTVVVKRGDKLNPVQQFHLFRFSDLILFYISLRPERRIYTHSHSTFTEFGYFFLLFHHSMPSPFHLHFHSVITTAPLHHILIWVSTAPHCHRHSHQEESREQAAGSESRSRSGRLFCLQPIFTIAEL